METTLLLNMRKFTKLACSFFHLLVGPLCSIVIPGKCLCIILEALCRKDGKMWIIKIK